MKKIYFIGIGGIGMSALARYYKHQGCFTAGYDRTKSTLTSLLESEGIEVCYQDSASLIPTSIINDSKNTLVIYTPAVPANSNLLTWFRANGFEMIKRSAALGHIASSKKTLAIAGTHGKTTTSTMLAHILEHSGMGCTAFLGGISVNYNTNLLLSKNSTLVAEADEFDRSFLQLWPSIAVITSADADHLDIYNNEESIKSAFAQFASQVKENGSLILKKEIGKEIEKNVKANILYYSFESECDFYASDIEVLEGGFFNFTFNYPKGKIEECNVGIPGWINVENAIAASAAAIIHGATPQMIKEALAAFKGVQRRFDIRINNVACSYIDDYAHHPKEIAAAISSIRNIFPGRKLTAIFQPHLYTRTRDFAQDFAESLGKLDQLILLDIYPARELPIEGVTSQIIFDNVKIEDKIMIKKEQLLEELSGREIDTLITFGAGDIDRLVTPITELLKKKYNIQ